LRTPAPAALTAVALLTAATAAAGEPAKPAKKALKVLVLERVVARWGFPSKAELERRRRAREKKGEPAADAGGKKVEKLRERHYTVKIARGVLRETCRETGKVTVINCERGLVWFIDVRNKTYRELSFEDVDRNAAEAIERLRRRLPVVSDPREEAKLTKLLGMTGQAPKLTVEEPEERKKVAGENCRRVTVKLDGKLFFRAWISERRSPLADRRWLGLGNCLPKAAAEKLAAVKGLLMEATFPLPGGGRLEIGTERLTEARAAPGDFDDPGSLDYKRLGRVGKSAAKKVGGGEKKSK
jgi:hypothetical protein